MNTAWITGSNGLIGSYLVQTAPRQVADWRVRALTRADFDLLNFSKVEKEFLKARPQLLIHCAAISTVGEAQKNPVLAWRANVEITRFLAELCEDGVNGLFNWQRQRKSAFMGQLDTWRYWSTRLQ